MQKSNKRCFLNPPARGLKLVAPQGNTPTEVMIFIWNTPITLRLGILNHNIILKMMVYEYPYLPLPITWNLVDPKKVKGKGRFLSLELNLEYPSSPLKLLRSESLSHIWYLKKTIPTQIKGSVCEIFEKVCASNTPPCSPWSLRIPCHPRPRITAKRSCSVHRDDARTALSSHVWARPASERVTQPARRQENHVELREL